MPAAGHRVLRVQRKVRLNCLPRAAPGYRPTGRSRTLNTSRHRNNAGDLSAIRQTPRHAKSNHDLLGAASMSLFSFHIQSPVQAGSSDPFEICGHDAWDEMTKVCADFIGEATLKLTQGSEWKMDLLDDARKPVFRIRLLAETLQGRSTI
jgi:hypothetical protein